MAKSEYTIRMDYRNAIKQAEKLEDIAADIRREASNDLCNCLNKIGNVWNSDTSKIFCRKGHDLEGEFRRTASDLMCTADTIRRIATNTYNAEMYALELAKKRDH